MKESIDKIDLSQYSTAHLLTPEKYEKVLEYLKKTSIKKEFTNA